MTPTLKATDPSASSNPPSAGSPLLRFYRSSVGKKLITGATGLGLALFVLAHMVGNLLLLGGRDLYNAYAHLIASFGVVFYGVELLLLAVVLAHAWIGVEIFWRRRQARPVGYSAYASAGGPSHQTLSSRTMIVTGSAMAVFLVSHLITFKFGTYYTTQLGDETVRDLSRLVIETFQKLPYVVGYSAILLLLGSHLRHGLWSALQSLGLLHRGVRGAVVVASGAIAAGIAAGFLLLPWAIYLGWVN
jgi:succinate dehydrogenase / fumarate reductase cytochrome b subunit